MTAHAVAANSDRTRAPSGADVVATVLATALSVLAFANFGFSGRGIVAAFVVSTLVVLARIDIERRVIPNRIVLPAAAIVLAAQVVLQPERALEWIVAALAAALALLLPSLMSPGAVGMGDVKLGLLLGAALGLDVLGALMVAFLLVFPVALWLLARGGAAARRRTIPFGPFLAAGAIAALLLA